jgi:hypothetical protein
MYGLILLSLAATVSAGSDEPRNLSRTVSVGSGLVSTAQVDAGYSPLVFSGWKASVGATHTRVKGRREMVFALDYAGGTLRNRHGRNLTSTSLGWSVITLYGRGEESPFSWGWAQNNHFDTRTVADFLNFTGRTDYFTSAGPAGRYSASFALGRHELAFRVLGHFQLLGFYIPSGYISSRPRGFGYEQDGILASILNSAFLFHPGSAINLALRPELQWRLGENSVLGLSYLYDFSYFRHIHSARRSRGNIGLSLTMGV